MRTREEIFKEKRFWIRNEGNIDHLILEVLLDVRELLMDREEPVSLGPIQTFDEFTDGRAPVDKSELMEDGIRRYEQAKKDGTLDEKFPRIA